MGMGNNTYNKMMDLIKKNKEKTTGNLEAWRKADEQAINNINNNNSSTEKTTTTNSTDNQTSNKKISMASYNQNHAVQVTIEGTSSNDTFKNHGNYAVIYGEAGNDKIVNCGSYVSIVGGKGNDSIDANSILGKDVTVSGGAGDDSINFYNYNTNVVQYANGDGKDTISGWNNSNKLYITGGSYTRETVGNDVIVHVGSGSIKISKGRWHDIKIVETQTAESKTSTYASNTNDSLNSLLNKLSKYSSSNTSLYNSKNRVTLNGSSNSDYLVGNSGNDIISGGAGNDSITGGAGNDSLLGDAGNDLIWGGKGNDSLLGGKGNDSLWGDAGNDTFIYSNGEGKDVIYGFENNDLLKITGVFSASYNKSKKEIAFKVGSTANAITLKDFGSTTTFNVNNTTYKLSGGKLIQK